MSGNHKERAHSKFSASGAERWLECPGSVALSEGLPDKESPYSLGGTMAHELLEGVTKATLKAGLSRVPTRIMDGVAARVNNAAIMFERENPRALKRPRVDREMRAHVANASNFLIDRHKRAPGSEFQVETRVYLDFIHPEMFGTLDNAVIQHFDWLDVFDFKYGAGHAVSPKRNLQMIFYALGLAHQIHWNFKRARLWIIQPRIKGYDGPVFWEVPAFELRSYVGVFERGVERVLTEPESYKSGPWCHWCKAKSKCPLKRQSKIEQAKNIFGIYQGEQHGKKEESEDFDEENFDGEVKSAWYENDENPF